MMYEFVERSDGLFIRVAYLSRKKRSLNHFFITWKTGQAVTFYNVIQMYNESEHLHVFGCLPSRSWAGLYETIGACIVK